MAYLFNQKLLPLLGAIYILQIVFVEPGKNWSFDCLCWFFCPKANKQRKQSHKLVDELRVPDELNK